MKNTLHTPGPWETMGFYISARNEELQLPNAQTIARVFPEHEMVGGNTLANARLISFAPDLLDALDWALRQIEDDLDPDHQAAFDAALSTLRKAKGEA